MFNVTHSVTGTVTNVTAQKSLGETMVEITTQVITRLEEAGRTLLALPGGGFSTSLQLGGVDVVREAIEAYGWTGTPLRPGAPSPGAITRMDEAMSWVSLIPGERLILRRIVGCRMLVHPLTERHLFPWRRLGKMLDQDHKLIQRWHGDGIDLIVRALSAQK